MATSQQAKKISFKQQRSAAVLWVTGLQSKKKTWDSNNLTEYPYASQIRVVESIVTLLKNLEYTGTIDGKRVPAPVPQKALFSDE